MTTIRRRGGRPFYDRPRVGVIRIATWNLKQAVAPKKPLSELWQWLEDRVDPSVAVLTEAKVPATGVPPGWGAVHVDGGFGGRRRWGTVVAARGPQIVPVSQVLVKRQTVTLEVTWPAAAQLVDVVIDGELWGTVLGIYGLTIGHNGASIGHGAYTIGTMFNQLDPLFSSDRADRLVVAGDFNMWPGEALGYARAAGLIDVVNHTAAERPPLVGCSGCSAGAPCGHLWTHKNGNSPNAARQQIDFIFASASLVKEMSAVYGGVQRFEDAWEVSDHAPVVAEFS
jgi:hypothetical protein